MLKIFSFITITLLSVELANAQKTFQVTIHLDSSINSKGIRCQYYNGKNTVILPDTFSNKNLLRFSDYYYSPSASFEIDYIDGTRTTYNSNFFLGEKPAAITLYFQPNKEFKLYYRAIKNAKPIFDTAANKTWARLNAFMTDTVMKKENQAFDLFLAKNPDFNKNDSVRRIFNGFYKSHLNRAMLFLKKYPNDYFSFWYFIQQVAQPEGVLRNDTAYLKEQLLYITSVFPAKFTNTAEGRALIEKYAEKYTLKRNTASPAFNVITIDGKRISLTKLKGKYVLLDFWATWCPPCMAEIPFLKELRQNYGSDKLVIIGISQDINLKQLKATVKEQAMDWQHYYDKNKRIGNSYGIKYLPTMVLLNKDGLVVYISDNKTADNEALPKILQALKNE